MVMTDTTQCSFPVFVSVAVKHFTTSGGTEAIRIKHYECECVCSSLVSDMQSAKSLRNIIFSRVGCLVGQTMYVWIFFTTLSQTFLIPRSIQRASQCLSLCISCTYMWRPRACIMPEQEALCTGIWNVGKRRKLLQFWTGLLFFVPPVPWAGSTQNSKQYVPAVLRWFLPNLLTNAYRRFLWWGLPNLLTNAYCRFLWWGLPNLLTNAYRPGYAPGGALRKTTYRVFRNKTPPSPLTCTRSEERGFTVAGLQIATEL
jgi:hypothetical protein